MHVYVQRHCSDFAIVLAVALINNKAGVTGLNLASISKGFGGQGCAEDSYRALSLVLRHSTTLKWLNCTLTATTSVLLRCACIHDVR